MTRKLKIFVWEDAFSDWFPGLAVAIAPDIRSARRAIIDAYGLGAAGSDYARTQLAVKPTIIPITDGMPAQAWMVSGGA